MRETRTETYIAASPRAVWAVLADFAAHQGWNPFLVQIEGAAQVGQRLAVKFDNGMTMKPTVTAVEPERVLEWLGSLGLRGLFDGRHRFELHPEGAGTRLEHSEQFSGVLVPLLGGLLNKTAGRFEALNAALKAKVEQGVPSGA